MKVICKINVSIFVFLLSFFFIVLGLFLMSGEGTDFNNFRFEIFSARRVKVAPVLCLTGYLLVILAIMWPRRDE